MNDTNQTAAEKIKSLQEQVEVNRQMRDEAIEEAGKMRKALEQIRDHCQHTNFSFESQSFAATAIANTALRALDKKEDGK